MEKGPSVSAESEGPQSEKCWEIFDYVITFSSQHVPRRATIAYFKCWPMPVVPLLEGK